MNGLFGNLHAAPTFPVHPDIAAADPLQPQPNAPVQQAPQLPPGTPAPMSAEQQATSAWLAQQEQQPKYKYSVGDPHIDKYLNMFLDAI